MGVHIEDLEKSNLISFTHPNNSKEQVLENYYQILQNIQAGHQDEKDSDVQNLYTVLAKYTL